VETGGPAALGDLYAQAARLVAPRAADWREVWRAGPAAQSERTAAQLAALAAGDPAHLAEAELFVADAVPGERFGMCGRLSGWDLDGAHPA
jgi:hypothetical protein